MGTISKSRELSYDEIQAFGAELDALRKETIAKLGKEDADYIYKIRNFVRYSEIGSRAALMTLGWLPPVWLAATATLGVSKIVENMELGHNVMHGQYDWMNEPSLRGSTYEWDTVCTADNWRHTHNYMHHTYTNVDGVDHDIGYGVLRIFPEQKWEPRFLLNPIMAGFLAVTFEWTLALQSLELEKVQAGEKTWADVRKQLPPIFAKMRKQFAKDYVFFPLIAGPMFLPVIAGNFTANIIRNLWAFGIIFCGHFTEDAEMFPKEVLENETRGHWYLRQLRGSSNLSGGPIMHIMSGNLSHQIEHHMFPDIPGMRYAEMSVKVREICEKYGQHYNTGSFAKQFSTVVGRIFKGALPNFGRKVEASAETAVARLADVVPVSKPARRKTREAVAA
ncbi:linoleoyl-CoA desaturase [Fluviicoccus keumensis]|uniref:Linoleoyl-CoA desaturase n=1 Tax=Fluviicoccus keumensis TaxID=1435465 RepID=A0A4Q7YMA2_9GAMM|nr:acyl-CoA desaturase [Fluviicoccus keumensis]RZU38448.1 linoleoyl-CoA desaturase [Fluviicoccus keumensis]